MNINSNQRVGKYIPIKKSVILALQINAENV